MAPSTHSLATIDLGKRLVQELGVEDSNDTLSRWMAHYIAEKIEEAQSAKSKTKRSPMRECFRAILELWEHRNAFPMGRRPFGNFESLFQTLSSLDIDDTTPRYFRMPRAVAADNVASESQKWLDAAANVDDAARVLIRYCLAVAAENAVDRSRDWVELIEALDRPKDFDVQIVHFLADDVDTLVNQARSDPQRERLEQLIKRLDAFMGVAGGISVHLKHQLRGSASSTDADKRRGAKASAKKAQKTRRRGRPGKPKPDKRRRGR